MVDRRGAKRRKMYETEVKGEYFKSIKCLNRYITEGWDAYVGSILSRDY